MTDRRVLLDAMLGKLARYLRMCGYDAAYVLDRGVEADEEIRTIAREEDRTLLTRDRSLAAGVADSHLLTSRDIQDQLRELAAAGFELTLAETPAHCGRCNGSLHEVAPAVETPPDVPHPTARTVWQCDACGQYYWKGSHWDDVARTLANL
ncbi:MAG: Mut7-C RNAse domain-containing protein [archaeon]